MIELIYVIVIIGILATGATMAMPDNRLYSDTNLIIQKIKQKQMQALRYDNFNYMTGSFIDDTTCIYINKNSINADEKKSAKAKPYQISSKTTISPNDLNICFDTLGRPFNVNNFLKMPIELNITYKKRTKQVLIMPFSGGMIVKR